MLPLSPSLWFNSPPHPPSLCEEVYCIIACSVCRGGGGGGGLRQTPAAKSLYRSIVLDEDILHCLL
jgi:hypothetical protein